MARLVIFLLTGFATILLASSFENCYDRNYFICGDTCSYDNKICYCGEKSYAMGNDNDLVCITNSDCMLDLDGMHTSQQGALF